MPDFKNRLARIRKQDAASNSTPDCVALDSAQDSSKHGDYNKNDESGIDFKKKLQRIKARKTSKDGNHEHMSMPAASAKIQNNETGFAKAGDKLVPVAATVRDSQFENAPWNRLSEYLETRTLTVATKQTLQTISQNWPVLVPQCRTYMEARGGISISDLLFFDLETTGLSGGAGTLAFLAAFGNFVDNMLCIRQYLLLDYAGEEEFLAVVERELFGNVLSAKRPGNIKKILVTYNGRAYDMQIVRNRFLLAGMHLDLDCNHLDLLYPARMLWKFRLSSCSQKDIEHEVLGIDRGFDLPGSEAPYAWFHFLRTGDRKRLVMVADHNARDIQGLAEIFLTMNRLLEDPISTEKQAGCNLRNLGFRWRHNTAERKLLLRKAAELQEPDALWDIALHCMEDGEEADALAALEQLANHESVSSMKRYEAFRKLAIYAERKYNDYQLALDWTDRALALKFLTTTARQDLQKRRKRLESRGGAK